MDVLCFGSLIVDHRRGADAAGPAVEPLRLVGRAVDLHVGGVPILAAAMKRMGLDVALMGCVGRDLAGYGLKAYLAGEFGLNVDAVRMIDAPTSTSFIRLTADQRCIDHTPGASAELLGGPEELAFVAKHRPALVAIGYSGLLARLDADGGRGMAEWIAAVQARGALAALDTHTVAPYSMLAGPVPVADVFCCNREEAEGITGVSMDSPAAAVAAMWDKYPPADPTRFRLLGAAAAKGVQLAYGSGGDHTDAWVANPYHGAFAPRDLTGAGDCFRAGLYAEILAARDAFTAGNLTAADLQRLGQTAHHVACEHLRR